VTGAVRALVYPVPDVGVVVHAFNIGAATCGWGKRRRSGPRRPRTVGRFGGDWSPIWIAPNVGRDALTYSSERTSSSMTQLAVSGSSYVGSGYLPSPCLAIGRSTFAAHPIASSRSTRLESSHILRRRASALVVATALPRYRRALARRSVTAHRAASEAGSQEGGGRDSNPRPPGPQPGALPTELPPPSGRQPSE
jgi:hypothetical protein